MAKSTRGKKIKPVRKARTPRQPKSNANDVQLRLELVRTFGYRHDQQSSEALINMCSTVYDYIKTGVGPALNVPSNGPSLEVNQPLSPDEVHIAVDPLPDPLRPDLAPHVKKSHFEEDRILM